MISLQDAWLNNVPWLQKYAFTFHAQKVWIVEGAIRPFIAVLLAKGL